MEWKLDGNVLIACNCDLGCPCNFNARPSRGKCEGGWIWAIETGEVGGVKVDGLAVALFADWPGAIHEGGGRAISLIDDRADPAQQAALSSLLRGEAGGPWGIFINTYQLEPPALAHFELDLADYATRVRIGDIVNLELKKIRNPVTQAESHSEVVMPEGIITKRCKMAASNVFTVRGGVGYDHSGQYAAFGAFAYAG